MEQIIRNQFDWYYNTPIGMFISVTFYFTFPKYSNRILKLWKYLANDQKNEMDFPSYFLARGSKLVMPSTFPKLNKLDIWMLRSFYSGMNKVTGIMDCLRRPVLLDIHYVDLQIPASYNIERTKEHMIPIRVYNFDKNSSKRKPVVIWYHGGGMIIGSMTMDHSICLKLANETGFIVVTVEYRLAPEHLYPAGANDSYDAFQWIQRHIHQYGGNGNKIMIIGESAGGSLTTAVTAKYLDSLRASLANDKAYNALLSAGDRTGIRNYVLEKSVVKAIVPVYPGLDSETNSPEAHELSKENGMLPITEAAWMRALYEKGGIETNAPSRRTEYLFSPGLAPDHVLEVYPPSLFILAKYDILTPEGLAFSQKLVQKGAYCRVKIYPSTIHAFFGRDFFPTGHEALVEASNFMKLWA